MRIHTTLILAAGDGDRFLPLKDKMRFRFNGVPLIRMIVEYAKKISETVLVVCSEQNIDKLKTDLEGTNITYVVQQGNVGGMADAVLSAGSFLTQDVLVLNSNDLFDFDYLEKMIKETQYKHAEFGFLAQEREAYFPGGYVVFEGDLPVAIMEKPEPGNIPSHFVKLTADYFPHPQLFIELLNSEKKGDDQYEKALSLILKKKNAVCMKYTGEWVTIKYSWQVLDVQDYVFKKLTKQHIESSAHIHKTALLDGAVHIGKNVTVGAYAKLSGPCFVEDGAIIGDYSLVRNSTVGQNALIGSGCEVARSHLSSGVMLHRNYVGDSVLSENVLMGAGAVTANFRFDKKAVRTPIKNQLVDSGRAKFGLIAGSNVKIGVNSILLPGIKLAEGTLVMPGEVVSKDK